MPCKLSHILDHQISTVKGLFGFAVYLEKLQKCFLQWS